MTEGPFGGPRPFADKECFPAYHKRFPMSAVDYSELNEVAKFESEWASKVFVDTDENTTILHTYKLNKPMSMILLYGHEMEEESADEFVEKLGRWFYTYRQPNPSGLDDDVYDFNDRLFISRFESLIETIKEGELSAVELGILYGYDPHNVAGFATNSNTEEFK